VLLNAVQGISDLINHVGLINSDFADVKTTMAGMGYAVMGTALRSGSNRAIEAAVAAMASPLLEDGAIDGARGILINISGSSTLKLSEVNEASSLIQNAAHEDANIIFGAVLDETMGDDVKITVIATGFRQEQPERRERMLNSVLNVHVPPVTFVRTESNGAAPRFAGEMHEESAAGVFRKAEQPPPIVYPVRQARSEEAPRRDPAVDEEYAPELDEGDALEFEPVLKEQPAMVAAGPDQRVFSEARDFHAEESHGEDLDVPAFLRRGGI